MQFYLRKLAFRSDINGLRAWAVGSVVLFHFLVPGFSGGFVGVDIFFVISGFLMTGIIVQGLVEQRFKVSLFYLARAVRIVPALVVLVLLLLGWAWFILPTPDYQSLAGNARYALIFWSNVEFAGADSYFAADSHENWLLHTWSLSVEWQFYILFPLLLMLIGKWSGNNLRVLFFNLVMVVVVSLAYSAWLSPIDPTPAFYLLWTRAWEMAAGGIVYFISLSSWRASFHNRECLYIGWLLLGLSFTLLHADLAWPGLWAALPVGGTMLILLAEREQDPLTRTKVAQWLGDRSYSIYLWHWPFAVWLYYSNQLDNVVYICLGIIASLFAGHMSYLWVEQPVRLGFKKRSSGQKTVLILLPLILVLGSSLVIRNVVFEGRINTEIERIAAEAENKNPRGDACRQSRSQLSEPCIYGGDELGAIVLGDSHAAVIIRSVEAVLPFEQQHVLDWTMSACPTIRNVRNSRRGEDRFLCPDFIEYALQQSSTLPDDVPLLIVNRISEYLHGDEETRTPEIYLTEPANEFSSELADELLQGFTETVCTFATQRPVFLLKPIPEMPADVPKVMSRMAHFTGQVERIKISEGGYQQRHRTALNAIDKIATQCNVELLDPTPALCSQGYCWGDHEGLPVYFDSDHLNERGGRLLMSEFKKMFRQELAPINNKEAE